MSALERHPQIPAPNPHKVLGPGIDGEESREAPSNSNGDWPLLRPPERVPEVPVVSREHLLQLKKFPDIPVSTLEESGESRPHPEETRFRLLAREEGSFPCVVGKEFSDFP